MTFYTNTKFTSISNTNTANIDIDTLSSKDYELHLLRRKLNSAIEMLGDDGDRLDKLFDLLMEQVSIRLAEIHIEASRVNADQRSMLEKRLFEMEARLKRLEDAMTSKSTLWPGDNWLGVQSERGQSGGPGDLSTEELVKLATSWESKYMR